MTYQALKRIPTILSMIPPSDHCYDMFCDHGKIGSEALKSGQCKHVTFVDVKNHLIENLKINHKEKNSTYFTEDARRIHIKENSIVLLCGVGGNLIIDCLKSYINQNNAHTLSFLVSPNMHALELRHFLMQNNLYGLKECVAQDSKRCYEVLLVTTSPSQEAKKIELFNKDHWSNKDKKHVYYLQSKLHDLEKKSHCLNFEKNYYQYVKDFL
jgi:tRNA A22 N-methylase